MPQAPYAVSTAALHLLSTIERDHVSPDPRADHLVPCCGHFMEIDAATDEVLNLGCPNGVDWSVRHPRVDQVALSFVGGEELSVHLREWRDAVVAFSSAVRAFYFGEAPKRPGDDYEAAWHARFLAEWERRHQQALTKQPGT